MCKHYKHTHIHNVWKYYLDDRIMHVYICLCSHVCAPMHKYMCTYMSLRVFKKLMENVDYEKTVHGFQNFFCSKLIF